MYLVGMGHKRHVCNRFGGWKANSNYFVFYAWKVKTGTLVAHINTHCHYPLAYLIDTGHSHLPWDPTLTSLTGPHVYLVLWQRAFSGRTPTSSKLEVSTTDITGSCLSLSLWVPDCICSPLLYIFSSWWPALWTSSSSLRQKTYRDCLTSSQHCVSSP